MAGMRTPSPIAKLQEDMPEVYEQFADIANRLENHYRDMQDMEFTIENGKLYHAPDPQRQAHRRRRPEDRRGPGGRGHDRRGGGRHARWSPSSWTALLHPQFDAAALKAAKVIGKGLAASPGAACGQRGLHRRGRQGVGRPGREGHPGPPGDLPRGHRGHGTSPRASSPSGAA